MDQEVAKTLGELELKLRELERELTSIGHGDAQAAPSQPPPPGKLVDEAMEPSASEQVLADDDGLGGPPVFGGEEVPSQAGATVERDWTVEVRETAYGEIPTPPGPPTPAGPPPPHTPSDPRRPAAVEESQSLDLAELVRFRDKLATTMDALIDEYSRLLHVERPPRPRRGV